MHHFARLTPLVLGAGGHQHRAHPRARAGRRGGPAHHQVPAARAQPDGGEGCAHRVHAPAAGRRARRAHQRRRVGPSRGRERAFRAWLGSSQARARLIGRKGAAGRGRAIDAWRRAAADAHADCSHEAFIVIGYWHFSLPGLSKGRALSASPCCGKYGRQPGCERVMAKCCKHGNA